ncbi:MAG: HD domain-containing phosphohydrolase, partial [Acidobacteriota bacterium]
TLEITHVYADTGMQAEHGYTALSRARGETHLWINDAPGPLGECTHIHGDPLTEDRIDALVRQLSQSVIEPPAHDQGLPVETATDRQLVGWRGELAATIRQSPIAVDRTDELIGVNLSVFHSQRQMLEDVEPFNEVIRKTGRYQGEVGHITRTGREFPTLMTTTVLKNSEGVPVEMVAVARDITESKKTQNETEARGRYLGCLAEISALMIETKDVLLFLPEVLRLLGETAVVSRTYIFANEILSNGDLACSRVAGWERKSAPKRPEDEGQRKLPYEANGLARWVEVLGAGEIIAGNVVDMPQTERTRLAPFKIQSLLLIPLFVSGDWYGYVGFDCCKAERSWSDQEIALLKVAAAQISAGIENHGLLEEVLLDARMMERSNIELKQAYEETLEGWARALELRDSDTEGHTRRVADLALKMGKELGLRENQLIHLHRGALLHDIGKMAVPDYILRKQGPLDDEEWAIMRRHPIYAYEMLSRINYLRPALAIPCSHHERWDGSGYPQGLEGEDIPLPARIFAVVDVWDALTSDRPYRKARSAEYTVAHLRDGSGTLYDPAVVEAFLSILEETS